MLDSTQSSPVRQVASTRLPTKWGMFRLLGFERDISNGTRRVETALVMMLGNPDSTGDTLVRIHSQCLTGEMLGSLRCDCRDQLELAMRAIARKGCGLLIYEHQEGRGIGLVAKLQAYAMQDAGLDTIEANRVLGFPVDCRDFSLPAAILHELGINSVRLLTNNPQKTQALVKHGIEVVEQISCEAASNPHSLPYLRTKQEMGHTLSLQPGGLADEANSASEANWEFASIRTAIRELRDGRMIVVVDDEDRENEGDLTMAAEMVTPEAITFMATHARGLICLAMDGERLDELDLDPMVVDNDALHGTAFTVSIDSKGPGVTTGISSQDRAHTIIAAVDPSSRAEDFARPGHVFPLRARPGGVLERRGQTESAVDLARLAGLSPAGVICEIVNEDGTMSRLPDLVKFCTKHDLLMVTVADLARYRLEMDDDQSMSALDRLLAVSA